MAESRASEILKENEWQIGPLKGDSSKLSFPVNTVAVPKLYNPSTLNTDLIFNSGSYNEFLLQ
jgi:hypothetical protein